MKKNIVIIIIILLVITILLCYKTNNSSLTRVIGGYVYYDNEPASKYTTDDINVYYDGKKIEANPKSIIVLTGYLTPLKGYLTYKYARDGKNIFYDGIPLENVFSYFFHPIENGAGAHSYGTDNRNIYFGSEIIPNADPNTFKILWLYPYEGCGKSHYSVDAIHVFYDAQIVPDANPKTFETLIKDYGKDARGYYKGPQYLGPDIDPKELVCDYG